MRSVRPPGVRTFRRTPFASAGTSAESADAVCPSSSPTCEPSWRTAAPFPEFTMTSRMLIARAPSVTRRTPAGCRHAVRLYPIATDGAITKCAARHGRAETESTQRSGFRASEKVVSRRESADTYAPQPVEHRGEHQQHRQGPQRPRGEQVGQDLRDAFRNGDERS